jgi:hypothetical protein
MIKSKRLRWAKQLARTGEGRGAYRILVEKPEEMRRPETPRRRLEYNIKMDLREVGWEHGLDRSGSGQGQLAGSCKCGNELYGFVKCGEFLD